MRLPVRVVACSILLASLAHAAPPVKLGIDVLRDDGFKELAGLHVGLVCNAASVDGAMRSTASVLHDAKGVNLVALASPEHGLGGEEYAGVAKPADAGGATMTDPATGLPVFDVYKAGASMKRFIDGVDAVVLDLQDLGARSSTYVSTMKQLLAECASRNRALIILDRPNPLGGVRVEGSMVGDPKFTSFVSYLNVPYLHGMTMGELALMTRDDVAPNYKKLTVIPMKGWQREMTWADTGLNWILTSPHIPNMSSIAGYASTGIMGELYQYSNGVGYTLPFEMAGGPDVDGAALADKLNKLWPDAPGVRFRPMRFKPFYATDVGDTCGGVQIYLDPHTAPSLVEINYRLIEALDGKKIMNAATQPTSPATTEASAKKRPSKAAAVNATPANLAGTIDIHTRRAMFDKVTGSDDIGDALARGDDLAPIFAKWRAQCDAFKRTRARYLLY